jgi:PhnB protein
MSKVSYIPKDYNSVTPYLIIKGAAQAIEYYKKVFGATETVRMNGPNGMVGHAELKIGDSHIMLADENPRMGQGHTSPATVGGSPVSLYVYFPDVDRVVEKAAAEGAKILKPVQDQF